MDLEQEILEIPNARLITAIYFSLLAVITTLIADILLYSIGIEYVMPLSKAIVLGAVVAFCFGALFGEGIVHCKRPVERRVFSLGFWMVVTSLPFYDLGVFFLIRETHPDLFIDSSLAHLAYLYLFVIVYSFILAGAWYGLIAGFAALFLRKRVVYFFTQSVKMPPPHETFDHEHNDTKQHKD
jgi:hypothetical protein